jgi:hypothetical protein
LPNTNSTFPVFCVVCRCAGFSKMVPMKMIR